MIAALFVQKDGAYYGIPDVDPWDEERDARLYPGPFPVVAHPPCQRWSRLAALVEAKGGKRRGEDGGCFASALDSVRRWGGVLEHPVGSAAWARFGLARPGPEGWTRTIDGGWVCQVEQGWYGHMARKPTWLYACGVSFLPSMRWGVSDAPFVVGKTQGRGRDRVPEMPKSLRSVTPILFRDLLLSIARSVAAEREAA
jgi:hypothetical protein